MMKTELVPFTDDMIPAAGKLLARRQARNRESLALLPARFEDPQVAAKAVEALWGKKSKNGYAAFRNGVMSAYLLGDHTTQPWARCGYAYLPGYALAEGESTSMLQDLYALLGNDWVEQGVFSHGFYVSAADPQVVEALFDLGFGKERIDAILDFKQVAIPEIHLPDGIQIRRAGPGDNDYLAGMSHLIFRELEKAPYWHPTPPEVWEDLRDGWAELANDESVEVWLALEGDETVGTIASWNEPEVATEMLVGPKTFTFSVAATRPENRGRGIGAALTWTCLAHGRKQGYEYCYTNWISPNLAASRYWPRFGFQEVAYRLSKQVNPMISWTRQNSKTGSPTRI